MPNRPLTRVAPPGAAQGSRMARHHMDPVTCPCQGLETCNSDVLHCIVSRLLPRDVVALSAAARTLSAACATQRQGTLLARQRLRIRLRSHRSVLSYRQSFVDSVWANAPASVEACLPRLVALLSSSEDGVRDLAAAVQKTLQRIDSQNLVPPSALKRVHQDCLNMASFVCLLAWKSRMRSRRASREDQGNQGVAVAAFEQEEAQQPAPQQQDAAPGEPPCASPQQPSQASSSSSSSSTGGHSSVDASSSTRTVLSSSPLQPAASDAGTQVNPLMLAGAPDHLQHDLPTDPTAAATLAPQQSQPPVQQQSTGMQTEHSTDLRELQDLVNGFQAISRSPNVHLRFSSASLQLLLFQLEKEVASWQQHPAEAVAEQVLGEMVAAAAAAAAAAAGQGDAAAE